MAKLREYEGVSVLRLDDPTGKQDVPLKTRTDRANQWQTNVLISFHHNANSGKWGQLGGRNVCVSKGQSDVFSVGGVATSDRCPNDWTA